jgi:hypothetical protein
MPGNFGRYGKRSAKEKRADVMGNKGRCAVCGRPLDVFHDMEACRKKWLAEQDAQGNPSNRRGQ